MEADIDRIAALAQRTQETSANLTAFSTLRPVEITLELPWMREIFRRKRDVQRVKLSPLRENRRLFDSSAERGTERIRITQKSLFSSPIRTDFRGKNRKETYLKRKLPAISLKSHTKRSKSVQKTPLGKFSFSLQKQEANRVMYFFPLTAEKD
jgi:hypothetical protein